jgi:GT2 family glycosyltransferase
LRPGIAVVIVNWNSGCLLDRCLNSFANVAADEVDLHSITVVDNASIDGSLACTERLHNRLPLRVIQNRENRGFAAACNQGAKGAAGDLLLFLNPDTLLHADSLAIPGAFLTAAENAKVGIVGIRLTDACGHAASSTSRRPSARLLIGTCLGLDRILPGVFPPLLVHAEARDVIRGVDQVVGAFFMVRRPLFEQLNGFDERFFLYFEDADFALRAHAAGMSTMFLGTASAEHVGHGSSRQVPAWRLFHFCRSRIAFARKHFGGGAGLAVELATLLAEPTLRVARAALQGSAAELRAVGHAYAMLWGDVLGIRRAETRQ